MTTTPRICIAGAGIGGLSAALALHARGLTATVLERSADPRPLGLGLNLLPHAVRELAALGLGPALADIAIAPHSIGFFDAQGTLLHREPRGVDGGYGHPQLSVHRGELAMLLLSTVRERLGAAAVRTGVTVTGADPDEVAADILVGADGIHSAVRAALHPDSRIRWSGVRMYRGITRMPAFLDGRTMAIIKGHNNSGQDMELITYPVGGGRTNWVLQVTLGHPGALSGAANWNTPTDQGAVRARLADWRIDWLDLDRLIGTAEQILEYPMVDRDPLPHWGIGPVTLLGDAAHPMYPVGANGASQAIVDAAALAAHLSADPGDPVAALRRYEAERRPLTTDVVLANREMLAAAADAPDELNTRARRYRHASHADQRRGA